MSLPNEKHGVLTRRKLLQQSATVAVLGTFTSMEARAASAGEERNMRGDQRLSPDQLHAWEALGYGMFIHFGMSTFVGEELPDGKAAATVYAPDRLDVDQWVAVARDAGMRYAVLTAKHVAGHCL